MDKQNEVPEAILGEFKEYYTALRLIYFASQEVKDFEDYEDVLEPLIKCDRIKRLIGED